MIPHLRDHNQDNSVQEIPRTVLVNEVRCLSYLNIVGFLRFNFHPVSLYRRVMTKLSSITTPES